MGIGRKNLFYSMVLAGSMLLFFLGYFVYMLPSLYVDYVMEQNLISVREQHDSYVRIGSYEGVAVRNSTACFSVEMPFDGNSILIAGKAFSAEITVTDERLEKVLKQCREKLQLYQSIDFTEEMTAVEEIFEKAVYEEVSLPAEIHLIRQRDIEKEFHNESIKVHPYSDTLIILETSVEDSANRYINYIAIEKRPEGLVLTYLPLIAPEMNEIRPIVLQSIPMLGVVILLMVLLFSQAYSKGIVTPIVKLVRYAGQMKCSLDFSERRTKEQARNFSSQKESGQPECGKLQKMDGASENSIFKAIKPTHGGRKDEVRMLADTLEDFYLQIKESMQELEKKNRELKEENERQEIFLRASSHQLKTPIAAALLLLDGMIHEVGKYKDTKVYLPRVKEQLLSMRKMVEDILYLNRCADNMQFRQIELGKLLEERLRAYQVPIGEKRLSVEFLGEKGLIVNTDEMMISQILDNLLSNAVKYTPEGGKIRIVLQQSKMGEAHSMEEVHSMEEAHSAEWSIRIENFGAAIPEELFPHIFEPFVSGSHGEEIAGTRSHGLGLYIASFYARKLGLVLSMHGGEGGEKCVAALLAGSDSQA